MQHKARFVVCGNEEGNNEGDSFSPLANFTIIKLTTCLAIQPKWCGRHYGSQSAFPNGALQLPVYVETPINLTKDGLRRSHVLNLHGSLYGLIDAAKIWHDLLVKQFNDL